MLAAIEVRALPRRGGDAAAAAPLPAVQVEDAHKAYRVPRGGPSSVKERISQGLHPMEHEVFEALHGVTFDVRQGEFFGIVGRNGSGKSTLLKIIAGIYSASGGRVQVAGRLSPFIEMGVGFKPELTGRENVLLNGAILGLSRREARARVPAVFDFAELEGFADLKLKNYSSGMSVRLAFATAVEANADVLLIDEVLAVGDAAFQQKCYGVFERFKREGRTVLFVSHNMSAVERFCDRALLLENGRVSALGSPEEIAERYTELNRRHAEERSRAEPVELPAAPAEPVFAEASPTTYRPSAMEGGVRRFGSLTLALARTDFLLHYQGSVLGYLWSVLRPLMMFAVLYTVLSKAGGFGRGVEHYPVYLLASLLLWTFFAEATGSGSTSLVGNGSLLRTLRFPRLAIPMSSAVKAMFNLGMNCIALAAVMAVAGVEPRLSWLEIPLLILLLAVLAVGVTLALSTMYVRYRDTNQVWQVVSQLLFYSSPILYVSASYPESVQDFLALTPLAAIFTEMRHALLDPTAPTAADAAGGAAMLAVPLGIIALSFVAGLWLFLRDAPRVAEQL